MWKTAIVRFVAAAGMALGFGGFLAAQAPWPPAYLTQWGGPSPGEGKFAIPYGVATDAQDNVFVVDINGVLQKFDRNGSFLVRVLQWAPGQQLNQPIDVAVDSAGNVYVTDAIRDQVIKFDNDLQFLLSFGTQGTGPGQFDQPMGICVDPAGRILVVEAVRNVVQRFDAAGNYLDSFGQSGTGDGQFDGATDVAVDSAGNLYVSDFRNHRIQKFDPARNYLAQWGSGNGGSLRPELMAINAADELLVADCSKSEIQKFAADGTFLGSLGSSGSGDGQFSCPGAVAVGASGDVYVSDGINQRIQRFGESSLTLTADRTRIAVGDTIGIRLFAGEPGRETFLFVTAVNATPLILPLFGGRLNGSGAWTLAGTVTAASAAGNQVTLTAFARNRFGRIEAAGPLVFDVQ